MLKHNYFLYHLDIKLTEDKKVKLIEEEAKNYYKKPCNHCGSYILKEEKTDNNGYLKSFWNAQA